MHGKLCFTFVGRFRPNLEQGFAAVGQGDFLLLSDEIAGNQGKEVRGFRERIFPDGIVASVEQFSLFDKIAIGKKVFVVFRRTNDHSVLGKNVGTIGEVGNAAEAFGLALSNVVVLTHVKSGELKVVARIDSRDDFNFRAFLNVVNNELSRTHVVLPGEGIFARDLDGD